MSSNKVPSLNVKLSGAANYPEWITSLKLFLRITDITDEHDAWDLVTGEFTKPAQAAEAKIWQKANDLTLLTILKNCEDNVRSRIGTCELAKDAYDELKKAYEGKTAMEFYALLDSLTNIPFDDRKNTIDEHITHYEATRNRFVGVISRADLTAAGDDGFGAGLQKFAKSDRTKSEFLLNPFPHLGNQPIGWNSQRQDVVALSITEAEYIADCEAAKDLSWASQFLKELDIEMSTPTLTTDSEGAYHLSKTSKFLRRSRHIEHRYYYIQ